MAQLPKTNHGTWDFIAKKSVTTIHEGSEANMVSTSSLTMEVEAVTHAFSWIASRGDSQTAHATILTDSMSLLQKRKVKWEAQIGTCQCLTYIFKNSCGCTALDMPEWREMTEQIDWRAKQSSQVAYISEDLKCWWAWDTTCRHKANGNTPLITWRREGCKDEVLKMKRSTIFLESMRKGHCQSDCLRWGLATYSYIATWVSSINCLIQPMESICRQKLK